MIEDRVDLSNDMTLRQMIGVGVRRVVLARERERVLFVSLREVSLINLRGHNTQRAERNCAERQEKPREQGTDRRRWRRGTRQRRAGRQRKKRQTRVHTVRGLALTYGRQRPAQHSISNTSCTSLWLRSHVLTLRSCTTAYHYQDAACNREAPDSARPKRSG